MNQPALHLLRALHGGAPGYTEIRPRPGRLARVPDGTRAWIPTPALERASWWAVGASRMGLEVYFGVMPRSAPRVGGATGIRAITALYVDVDTDGAGVWRRWRHLPWTAVVGSGAGIHLHARLASSLDPMYHLDRWDRIERGVIGLVGGDPVVCDVARVLRVPGTVSWKRAGAPVELLDLPGRVAPVEEWEAILGLPGTDSVRPAPPPGGPWEPTSHGPPGGDPGGQQSFRSYADAVSVTRVISFYGLDGWIRKAGPGWRGSCFLHGGTNERAFNITADDKRWMCWTRGCGQPGGSVVDLVQMLERGDLGRATRVLRHIMGGPPVARAYWPPGG